MFFKLQNLFAGLLLLVVILAAFASTENVPTTAAPIINIHFLCKGHKDGEYLPDPKDPHVYYECMRNRAIKFQCPKSTDGVLIFDPVKHVCVFPPN